MKIAAIFITVLFSAVFNDGISVEKNGKMIMEDDFLSNEAVNLLPQSSMDVPNGGGSCLTTHNKLRALHSGTNKLVWDAALARGAQKWAKHLASILDMQHSGRADRPGQGENLAYGEVSPDTRPPRTCENAIIAWYSEIGDFNWNTRGKKYKSKAIGHFTQVVWKNSKKLGMGIATRKANGKLYTYIVARYSPAGNVGGQYFGNVMPLKGTSSPCDSNPCQNGGTCINKYIKYECQCTAMASGSNCETKRECKDAGTFGGCKQWQATICNNDSYKTYMVQCLKTCKKCTANTAPAPAPAPAPVPSATCKDKKSYCQSYKNLICYDSGYASYKPNCDKTCGKCK